MKQIKRIIAIAFFSLLSIAQASAVSNNDSVKNLPVKLKYAGMYKEKPLLQLDFSGSKEENEFTISITDESGYTFYSDNVKGEKFSKQFLLDMDNLGDDTLRFEITGKKSGKTVTYEVSRQTNITEQMNLVKL